MFFPSMDATWKCSVIAEMASLTNSLIAKQLPPVLASEGSKAADV